MSFLVQWQIHVGNRPVVGLRLQLVGRKSNRLAIRLQHLGSLPNSSQLSDNEDAYSSCKSHQKVRRNRFLYVCTTPVESDDALSIVTGATLQFKNRCLSFLLCFSKVIGSTLQEKPVRDFKPNTDNLSHKSLGFCRLFTKETKYTYHPTPGEVTISSPVCPVGPPMQ